MHGLVNRALQRFTEDTYGVETWRAVVAEACLPSPCFEAMRSYDDSVTRFVLDALAARIGWPVENVLEDLGTYLVSHERSRVLRRLLRFGGEDFTEFLHSLVDLPDRTRLAVADLAPPAIDVTEPEPGQFEIALAAGWPGFGCVLLGGVRAMADDYGVLALAELAAAGPDGAAWLRVSVAEAAFAQGRSFELSVPGAS